MIILFFFFKKDIHVVSLSPKLADVASRSAKLDDVSVDVAIEV